MAEAVPVRCPACLRENGYTAPVFPCACGSPVRPPLDLTAPPVALTHRTWSDSWVAVRCGSCGREGEWPHPELGCGSCGTVVRIPVHPVERPAPGTPAGPGRGDGLREDRPDRRRGRVEDHRGGLPAHIPLPPTAPGPRPAFRPVTIRTARDAVATAALYLRWLGFPDVRQPDGRPVPSAVVDLRAPGLVAQVDPTTAPAGLRAVECVWLNGLTASATSVYFSLAGYTQEARARADDLGVPLFVMDLTGMPQPVNDPADELMGPDPRDA
ncbi:hypothetical protein AMK16_05520 [Streptomyces sp. CB00455]|uniref:hypothetical protein n=1 Tax=Streptomyces sp. CB00455 TaxID=1703927 RepID=UPI00093B99AB|nr:hypothetical protein [Streptomyces sp. CB00455]OKK22565.1 hypothetical protein AMK16_05520 [Streptomyces sp. CB00455]